MANPEHLAKLREGVEAWNQWRRENCKEYLDLRSANLAQTNLTDANLAGTNLRNADLVRVNLAGANLRSADLLEVNLSGANLRETYLAAAELAAANLTEANLTRANLTEANLTRANLTGANLQETIFPHNLQGAILNNGNLRYAYLPGADLRHAKLLGTDLRYADLQGVILSHADLRCADFSYADLTGAILQSANLQDTILTGACLQDWNINIQTQLDNITCNYIYLSRQYKDRQWTYTERRPHNPNRNFEPGEFAQLFEIITDTLDLVFNNGIEWSTFVCVFKQFRQELQSNDISIQAIEKKSDGTFVIRVEVPPDSNKAELEATFKQRYETELKAIDARYREQLQAKDREIIEIYRQKSTDIVEITKILGSRPIAIENKNTMTEESKYDQRGAQFGGGFAAQGNQYGGSINNYNYAAENKQNLAEAAAEIRQLLDELAQSYPTQTMPEKMVVATKAIEKIESDPNWKQRIVNAAKVGGVQALEKAIDNPFGAFVAGAIEGWQES